MVDIQERWGLRTLDRCLISGFPTFELPRYNLVCPRYFDWM